MKKNGRTYYGKQNHQCKDCSRQSVLKNKHTKQKWVKSLIKKALKERYGRGKADARQFWANLPSDLKTCDVETDHWEAYRRLIPPAQHKVGKDLTFYIEGFNTTIRARVSRLVRKTLSFSKWDKWHNLAIGWFFWQLNLEKL